VAKEDVRDNQEYIFRRKLFLEAMAHPTDGKYVVTQDGKRVSGQLHETSQQAQAEADKLKEKQPVKEGQAPASQPTVKQNLCG
jgi:hypothetical protein